MKLQLPYYLNSDEDTRSEGFDLSVGGHAFGPQPTGQRLARQGLSIEPGGADGDQQHHAQHRQDTEQRAAGARRRARGFGVVSQGHRFWRSIPS